MTPWRCPSCGTATVLDAHEFPITCCDIRWDSPADVHLSPAVAESIRRKSTAKSSGPSPIVVNGVGAILKEIIKSLDIVEFHGCGCGSLVSQMNQWGPDGCRDQLDFIVNHLEETAKHYNWKQKALAAAKAIKSGLAVKINPRDPFRSLVLESIRQAEEGMPITKRNLIYHICPLKANDVWKHNVKRLLKGMDAFNGKKVIAIALGPEMVAPSTVKRMFRGHNVKFLEIPNDKRLREVATFLPLLEAVQSTNKNEATFYAHTKGNSTAENKTGAMYWRNAMYQHLLYDWKNCMKYLEQGYLAVGTHKMVWGRLRSPYPSRLRFGQWMFAGTFFWFRNDAVFTSNWRNIPDDRYGAEAWLSGMLHQDNVKSVYQLWPESQFPTPSPYNPKLYKNPIADK